MRNSMEVPQKINNRINIWSSNPTSRYISKGNKSSSQRDIYTVLFMAVLFTVTKIWKQPKCLLIDKWTNNMQYILGMFILLSFVFFRRVNKRLTFCNKSIDTLNITHTHTHTYKNQTLKKKEILPFATCLKCSCSRVMGLLFSLLKCSSPR